jgi:hypothetical protein
VDALEGGPALHDVGDVRVLAAKTSVAEQRVHGLPGIADEGQARRILEA